MQTVAAFFFYNCRMPIFLQHRRLTSLIVSLAILLNLCVPALSQAVTLFSFDPLASDICSAAVPDRHAPAQLPLHGAKHCALCAAHHDDAAPPPAGASLLAVLEGHDVYPALRGEAPWPARQPAAAQPRGPPARA